MQAMFVRFHTEPFLRTRKSGIPRKLCIDEQPLSRERLRSATYKRAAWDT